NQNSARGINSGTTFFFESASSVPANGPFTKLKKYSIPIHRIPAKMCNQRNSWSKPLIDVSPFKVTMSSAGELVHSASVSNARRRDRLLYSRGQGGASDKVTCCVISMIDFGFAKKGDAVNEKRKYFLGVVVCLAMVLAAAYGQEKKESTASAD